MFGRRFFGARFYGARYFGDGASAPVTTTNSNLFNVTRRARAGIGARRKRRE